MLASHYAPRKPLYILPDFGAAGDFWPLKTHPQSFALMITRGDGYAELQTLKSLNLTPVQTLILSAEIDPAKVARELFAAMRRLDASSAEILLTNEISATDDLWPAIGDRIRRASTKN